MGAKHRPRITSRIVEKAVGLRSVEYSTYEVAQEIGVSTCAIYTSYLASGCPRTYNERGYVRIPGTEFAEWVTRLFQEDEKRRQASHSWNHVRERVWQRDNGVCQVCGEHISKEVYECGHLVDRVCGGSDDPDNLVVMCGICNRCLKPLHETREEALAWMRETRHSMTRLRQMMLLLKCSRSWPRGDER